MEEGGRREGGKIDGLWLHKWSCGAGAAQTWLRSLQCLLHNIYYPIMPGGGEEKLHPETQNRTKFSVNRAWVGIMRVLSLASGYLKDLLSLLSKKMNFYSKNNDVEGF